MLQKSSSEGILSFLQLMKAVLVCCASFKVNRLCFVKLKHLVSKSNNAIVQSTVRSCIEDNDVGNLFFFVLHAIPDSLGLDYWVAWHRC